MERVMDLWQYEGASDAENRQTLIRSRGFCPRHTWQLTRLTHLPTIFPLALVYRDTLPEILDDVKRNLEQIKARNQPEHKRFWNKLWRKWRRQPLLSNSEPLFLQCRLCERQAEIEQQLISELLTLVSREDLQTQISRATGFCLAHVTQALRSANSDTQRIALLEHQYACLQRNFGEIEELVRKHDYRFLHEPRGEEMTAWRRAVELFVGNAGVR
jgi:hypothetical protein